MINLTVISLKDIGKILKKMLLIIIIFFIFFKLLQNFKKDITFSKINTNCITEKFYSKIIEKNILVTNINENNNKGKSGIKRILMSELAILQSEEELMELENQEEVIEFNNVIDSNITENNQDIIPNQIENKEKIADKEIPNTLQTKVIAENNKTDKFTDFYQSVKIKNESQYKLTQEMVTPDIDFLNKKDIIIYHTHTCESYTPTPENNYIASGNFRTIDLNYSISRVGSELENFLKGFGYNVLHDSTYHDYPAYTGSYTRALNTIQNILQNNPDTQLVIDLHRDALGSNSKYAPSVQIGEEIAAQLMFVIGTNGGGLEHENWLNNFKLAIKIQEKANEMYPGLFKPIILRDSRYNQHVTSGACIIEVGATGNTLEQCNISMKYLANVLKEVLK